MDGVAIDLWQILNDCELWRSSNSRGGLFRVGGREWREELWAPELVESLSVLRAVSAGTDLARSDDLAVAAANVWEWAEQNQLVETALQFSELAARLSPASPERSATAGRLSRRIGDVRRATRWFMRAIRLARLADNEVALATAHLGWGMLYFNQGDYLHAEVHFTRGYRCAMRAGFHGLAGSATHDILVVSISSGRYDDAMPQATAAAKLYTADHPRFPLLAHDVAFLLSRLGYYSSALPVLEKCLPFVEGTRERILVLATLARAAGAVRDRLRFERAAAEVVRLAAHSEEMSDMSLYHVAQGARGFEMWERARELGGRAAAIATRSGNKYILQAAPALLNSIENREPGDEDVVPPEGGEIDALVAKLLKRLQKHTAPHDGRAVPVEKFPKY